MLKQQRLNIIQELLSQKEIVQVSDLTNILNVTEMTVRRDLKTLEDAGKLLRIHGGAKHVDNSFNKELSHIEKQEIMIEEKKYISKKIANLIKSGDTIFLGPSTTIENVYDYMEDFPTRIITNSIHVFNKFNNSNKYDLILIGGSYRYRAGAFVGSIANQALSKMRISKAFIGTNGISRNEIYTANEEEGTTQEIVLNNAREKYIVADSSKIDKEDFYMFYNLDEITALITDEKITDKEKKDIEKYTRIIC